MEKIWILLIAVLLFLGITFLFWKFTRGYAKKESGNKMWQQWTTRTYYWQFVLLVSGALTVLVLFILKWAKVLTF
jgi:hypothetical protein